MNRRATPASALAALAVATIGLSACTGTSTTSPDQTSKTATTTPASELATATSTLAEQTFAMTMTVKIDGTDARLTGAMDPAHKRGAFTATTDVDGRRSVQEWRLIGSDIYLKTNTPALPGTSAKPWRRIDAKASGGNLADGLNGAKIADPLRHATAVQRTGKGHYSGSITAASLSGFLDSSASSSGPSAPTSAQVNFAAEVDGQHRLTRFHLDVPRAKGGTYPIDIVYSGFGESVDVQAPPADQVADSAG
ncbi:hypothetical protein [Actinoplanes sp. NPDC051411]|uniref:hypothetical protein n=1 Tax=Actinoplanes sp. NPDC051411 TaxID=3155522 RepID=UPI003422E732